MEKINAGQSHSSEINDSSNSSTVNAPIPTLSAFTSHLLKGLSTSLASVPEPKPVELQANYLSGPRDPNSFNNCNPDLVNGQATATTSCSSNLNHPTLYQTQVPKKEIVKMEPHPSQQSQVQEHDEDQDFDEDALFIDLDAQTTDADLDPIPIKCNRINAWLYKTKLGSGSKGKCIQLDDRDTWLTPEKFLFYCGRNAKDWRRGGIYTDEGRSLMDLIRTRILNPHVSKCLCSICLDDETDVTQVQHIKPYVMRKRRGIFQIVRNAPPLKRQTLESNYEPTDTDNVGNSSSNSSELGSQPPLLTADDCNSTVPEPEIVELENPKNRGLKMVAETLMQINAMVTVNPLPVDKENWQILEDLANKLVAEACCLKQSIADLRQKRQRDSDEANCRAEGQNIKNATLLGVPTNQVPIPQYQIPLHGQQNQIRIENLEKPDAPAPSQMLGRSYCLSKIVEPSMQPKLKVYQNPRFVYPPQPQAYSIIQEQRQHVPIQVQTPSARPRQFVNNQTQNVHINQVNQLHGMRQSRTDPSAGLLYQNQTHAILQRQISNSKAVISPSADDDSKLTLVKDPVKNQYFLRGLGSGPDRVILLPDHLQAQFNQVPNWVPVNISFADTRKT